MWPGRRRSAGRVWGWIATWMVRARSSAEIPVLTPFSGPASTLTVKAVWLLSVLRSTISGRSRASSRSPSMARQIRPRASVAMKLICSGVANCAAQIRSPSFSRFSSSTTTIDSPLRIAARPSATESKAMRSSPFKATSGLEPDGRGVELESRRRVNGVRAGSRPWRNHPL